LLRPADWSNGILVVKWDLENKQPMIGNATRRVRLMIEELDTEGKL